MKKTKKLLALVLALMLLLTPTACKNKEDDAQKEPFDAEKVLSQLKVEDHALTIDETYGPDTHSIVLLVENTSHFGVNMHCKLTTYDKEGYVVDMLNEEQNAVAGGTETVFFFDDIRDFSSYDYEFTVTEASEEKCIADQFDYEIDEGKDRFFVNVTNNSERKATTVLGYMLFYNGDTLVGCTRNGHMGDIDLSAGKSESAEYLKPEDAFDSYKFVITGEPATW